MKDYNKFILEYNTSEDDERDIILENIIPFIIGKYNALIKWAESQSNTDGINLKKIIFEKKYDDDTGWDVYLIVPGWSNNEANRIIQYVLLKHCREFATIQEIEINNVTYAALHSVTDSFDSLTYDVENKREIRKQIKY